LQALELPLALVLRLPPLHLGFRCPRALVVRGGRAPLIGELPVVQCLLSRPLSGVEAIQRLLLPRFRGRDPRCPLLLAHPELQRIFLLLPLDLLLLHGPRGVIFGRTRPRDRRQQRHCATQDFDFAALFSHP
jgi:hypothetical protein